LSTSDVPARYFFLSYAHTPPASDAPAREPEHWVNVFFADLTEQVRRRADPTKRLRPGFCEAALPPGTDSNAAMTEALAGAQVFVPLLSPHYFSKSWPQRELQSFRRRLTALDDVRQRRRVVPVLWISLPSWRHDDDVKRATMLGAEVPNYGVDGLQALLRLSSDHGNYHEIVNRVAERIVEVAEGELLPSARPPVLITDLTAKEPTEAPLVVKTLAPGAVTGDVEPEWRPFGDAQSVSPAAAVVNVAERFSLNAHVEQAGKRGGLQYQYPTVLLIDPRVVGTPDGETALRQAVRHAPQWVTPLVLTDRRASAAAGGLDDLVELTRSILPARGDNRARWAFDLNEFTALTPEIVAAAYRHYLQRNVVVKEPGDTDNSGRTATPGPSRGEKTDD
jgi:hypothetical protein